MHGVHEVMGSDRLHDAISDADAVVLACALTPKTERMLGEAEFALMRDDAWVINVGRGRLIDTEALVRALTAGALAGAALDVTDPEPLPADHPLWADPNCIIPSHSADTPLMTKHLLAARIASNVRAFLGEGPFIGVVDTRSGY